MKTYQHRVIVEKDLTAATNRYIALYGVSDTVESQTNGEDVLALEIIEYDLAFRQRVSGLTEFFPLNATMHYVSTPYPLSAPEGAVPFFAYTESYIVFMSYVDGEWAVACRVWRRSGR